jgi:segregation and condensation protein A
MHVEEKTIPWWRRALKFALGGIRSGFGLFPRSAKAEGAPEEKILETPKEKLEEETVLTEASPQPEVVAAAKTIPIEPVTESKSQAEPVAAVEEGTLATPVLPVGQSAALDTVSAMPEPVAVDVMEVEPVTVEAAIDEVVKEAAPESVEEDEAVAEEAASEVAEADEDKADVEAESESAESAEAGLEEHVVEELDEEVEAVVETEPEVAPPAEAVIANEPDPEPIECVEAIVEEEILSEAIAESVAVDGPVVEAELENAEAEAVNAADEEPVEEVQAMAEAEPEAAETTAEVVNERDSEPVEIAEANAEEEMVNEVIEEPLQEPETVVAVEAEVEIITEVEAVNEAVAEPIEIVEAVEKAKPEPAIEPAPAPEPAPDGVLPLVLKAPPTAEEAAAEKADEKAAAKLAARQKKLDESSEQSPFSVIVGQVYDGPLDLLLDLIRKQDIDIYDIPIAKITAQFLAYVNQLKAGDMDVAGEFIYTASLLIHIKSKMLLPRMETGPDDASEDPRRELVERLLEHERFKNAAQMLQQKQMLEAATWSNPGVREFKGDEATEPEIAADTVDLVRIFRDILERARKRPTFNVEEDSVTVGQMIQFLGRRLAMEDKPLALRRLLSHTHSERALIAMFLALLELVRMQAILLRQDLAFSEIFVKKHSGFDAVMTDGMTNAHDDWR